MLHLWRSRSDDVYTNMAIEQWLLKQSEASHLFFWVNRPCVVIGRNQVPWHEVNTANVYRDGVDYVRRMSGGGAVYHDYGNLNISFIASTSAAQNMQRVQAVLATLGIDVNIGSRNELLLADKKISGSAYYLFRGRRLHHLTLLVDAELSRVWQYLLPKRCARTTTAVASVRQAVTNIADCRTDLTVQRVVDAFATYYQSAVVPIVLDNCHIAEGRRHFMSWQWNYGRTPTFTEQIGDVRITVKRGRFYQIEGLTGVSHQLIGQIYHPNSIANQWVKVN